MIERAIQPLACLGLVVGAWSYSGWGLGVGMAVTICIVAHERKVARRNQAWRERWEQREQTWRSLERRAR